MTSAKLALGTVQFGQPYGVANKHGVLSFKEVADILGYARAAGIDLLDTAVSYGESESRLGRAGVDSFQIVSKLPSMPEEVQNATQWLRNELHASLFRLRVEKLHGLLLHAPGQLLGPRGQELWGALQEVKKQGLVQKVGISVYGPSELDAIMPLFPADVVQAPLSLVDRRLVETGWLRCLHERGTEVHVRSVFLQGLLLSPQSEIPVKFAKWSHLWNQWHDWLRQTGLSPQRACLAFVGSFPQVDRVVVGVDSLSHLQDLVAVTDAYLPDNLPRIQCEDEELINPSLWCKI